jgi:hypothetical protein
MKIKAALIGLAAAAGLALSTGAASAAMPSGLPASGVAAKADQVRWVCNAWGRCWWRPNYYGGYGYYGGGPRFYGGRGYYGGGPRFYGGGGRGYYGGRGGHRHWR